MFFICMPEHLSKKHISTDHAVLSLRLFFLICFLALSVYGGGGGGGGKCKEAERIPLSTRAEARKKERISPWDDDVKN